jgi:hypothetical protein
MTWAACVALCLMLFAVREASLCDLHGTMGECRRNDEFYNVTVDDIKVRDVYWVGGAIVPDARQAKVRFPKLRVRNVMKLGANILRNYYGNC